MALWNFFTPNPRSPRALFIAVQGIPGNQKKYSWPTSITLVAGRPAVVPLVLVTSGF